MTITSKKLTIAIKKYVFERNHMARYHDRTVAYLGSQPFDLFAGVRVGGHTDGGLVPGRRLGQNSEPDF